MEAVRPLAGGFGVETAMTIDAVRAGVRVVEIPIEGLEHRPTYRTARGFAPPRPAGLGHRESGPAADRPMTRSDARR